MGGAEMAGGCFLWLRALREVGFVKVQDLSGMLIRYERYRSMTDPVRFAGSSLHQKNIPEFYAMDPRMFTLLPAERASSIIQRTDATDLLEKLLAGQPVDSAKMERVLGVSYEALMNCMAELDPIKKPIPDKTVVVTFDDAKKDHVSHVAPLFQELGFNATFFVTEMEPSPRGSGFEDKTRYMTWEEIAKLDAMGFEIGNHSLHHRRPSDPLDREDFAAELNGLNDRMHSNGISRAVSVAYPFGMTTSEQVAVADECGMKWGRGNLGTGICGTSGKCTYDPRADHPLAIPSYGDAPLYTYERLLERLSLARDGHVLCLAYHSVLERDEWTNEIDYQAHFRFIAEHGYRCISMKQLEEYIDPVKAKAYTAE